MNITGISINTDEGRLQGSASRLQGELEFFQSCGFDGVELSIHALDVLVNGKLRQPHLDKIRAVTSKFSFLYTVHAPNRLNFAFPQRWSGHPSDLDRERDVFVACLDFCAAVGATVLVYHSGLIALREVAFGLALLPDDDALEHARKQEVATLRELMPLAAKRGVIVAMENRNPHPWEVAVLVQNKLLPEQLPKYHAGMVIPNLIRQVEEVDHPNLGITLDFGHLFLAATYCGFDYPEAIRMAAPYVRHLHGNDNAGRLGGVVSKQSDQITYGDGDTHFPPGWGEIPHVQALSQLPDYEGMYVLELHPRFRDYCAEALETIRHFVHTKGVFPT
ncbi:MAG: sugar phosphate isomerase/epimerase [bacterium]|nr:sugar phosphate isomerase/epimerase [bacterium]